jgi:hypothetical protein
VFLGVTELVQGPEGVIPSLVWLEPPKYRSDFRRQIPTNVPRTVDVVVEVGQRVGEGKVGLFELNVPTRDRGGVAGLVEGGSEVAGNIEQNAGKHLGQLSRELDLVNMLSRLRIFINDMGPRVTIDKVIDQHIEILDVLLCMDQR